MVVRINCTGCHRKTFLSLSAIFLPALTWEGGVVNTTKTSWVFLVMSVAVVAPAAHGHTPYDKRRCLYILTVSEKTRLTRRKRERESLRGQAGRQTHFFVLFIQGVHLCSVELKSNFTSPVSRTSEHGACLHRYMCTRFLDFCRKNTSKYQNKRVYHYIMYE